MERVMIIGSGGSGKTTLARQLGEKTGLPVVHFDQIFWSPGNWKHLEREEFDVLLQKELEKPRWILDGNYNRTLEPRLERCDTVIYLDFPRLVSFTGWLRRVIKNWGHAREDMAEGCTEWFDPEMAKWVWTFNRKNRARYHQILAAQTDKTVHIFRSRRKVKQFLDSL